MKKLIQKSEIDLNLAQDFTNESMIIKKNYASKDISDELKTSSDYESKTTIEETKMKKTCLKY